MEDTDPDDTNNPILQKIDEKFAEDPDAVNAWYQQNRQISQVLQLIADGMTIGEFENDDIALDLTVSSMMSFMLGIRDTNQDGYINDDDFNLSFVLENVNDIEAYEFEGLYDAFSDNPENINPFIDFILDSANNSTEGILLLVGEDQEDFIGQINENIEDARGFLGIYRYGDGIDNDDDGSIDEEAFDGIDNDGDGFTDEDTHGSVN
jgi:hypothetical protein